MSIHHPKLGMDVEVRGIAGRWMIVAFGERGVRVSALDWPAETRWVDASDLREAWPDAYLRSPIERLVDGGR